MRFPIGIMLLVTLVVVAGCSTVQVNQDYEVHSNLTRYETWQWKEAVQPTNGDLRTDNPLLNKRIRRAIENHLTGRRIRLVPKGADLQLSYQLTIEQKIIGDTIYPTVGIGVYGFPWYGGMGSETRIRQFDEGRLTIDLHATDTGELLWRGVGIYRWVTYDNPRQAADAMQEIVDKILEQYPPTGLEGG